MGSLLNYYMSTDQIFKQRSLQLGRSFSGRFPSHFSWPCPHWGIFLHCVFQLFFTLVCFVMWKSWLAGFWKQDSTSNTVSNIWQNNFQTRHLFSRKRPDEIWKCMQIYCARTYQQAYFLLDVQGQLIWGEQQEGHSFPILQTQECLSTKFSQFPHYQQCLGPFCEPDQETCSA